MSKKVDKNIYDNGFSPFEKGGIFNPDDDYPLDDDEMTSLEDFGSLYGQYVSEPKPPLKFQLEGKEVTIYGGSCHHPTIDDADVYVSLDEEQPVYYWEQPWYQNEGKTHIRFPIEDMSIPKESEDFKYLIEHIQYELFQGKKLHVGCIGGHGRTGMVLSALVQQSMGDKLVDEDGNKISAVDYVREHYAKKAVETVPQMLFLHYNFGIEFPKDNIKEINKFLDLFKKEIGLSLDDVLDKGADFDEIVDVLKEVDYNMYSQSKFLRPAVGKNDFINPPHLAKTDSKDITYQDLPSSGTKYKP